MVEERAQIVQKKKKGFSVMEIMIVLAVITTLFAAVTPFMTKRRNSIEYTKAPVWSEVPGKPDSVFFSPGSTKMSSTAYFGFDPAGVRMSKPAKIVIKANDESIMPTGAGPQRMISFRKDNADAGSLFMDDKANLFLGSSNSKLINNHSANYNNTVMGMGATGNILGGNNITAIGANAAAGGNKTAEFTGNTSLIAIGANAARDILGNAAGSFTFTNSEESMDATSAGTGIYIGANAGRYTKNAWSNIAIGTDAMSSQVIGANSVAIGYNSGNTFINDSSNTALGSRNVVIGNDTIIPNNYNDENTIIGAMAGQDESYSGGSGIAGARLTSVGAKTCSYPTATCIGYESGYSNKNVRGKGVYLGGKPKGGFPGDAILEVFPEGNGSYRNPTSNRASVVVNSNLVVRGNFYVANPSTNTGVPSALTKGVNLARDDSSNYNGYCTSNSKRYKSVWIANTNYWSDPTENKVDLCSPPTQSGLVLNSASACAGSSSSYDFTAACPQVKSSDVRLKENIKLSKIGLKELKNLNTAYRFTFKDDSEKIPQVGVIAQQLQKVFPNSVIKDSEGYLRIRWDEMFYAMINALKELNSKITSIVNDIASMTNDVQNITSETKRISKKLNKIDKQISKLERH